MHASAAPASNKVPTQGANRPDRRKLVETRLLDVDSRGMEVLHSLEQLA